MQSLYTCECENGYPESISNKHSEITCNQCGIIVAICSTIPQETIISDKLPTKDIQTRKTLPIKRKKEPLQPKKKQNVVSLDEWGIQGGIFVTTKGIRLGIYYQNDIEFPKNTMVLTRNGSKLKPRKSKQCEKNIVFVSYGKVCKKRSLELNSEEDE